VVTQNRGDLGNLRGKTLRKAWHTGGNLPNGAADFYPLLAQVGSEVFRAARLQAAQYRTITSGKVAITQSYPKLSGQKREARAMATSNLPHKQLPKI